ncbi:hypothetical protein A2334_04105 [Candidatus Roizmanbacteria bacterium RIFOXYB2_FULL_38_10]|uniref:ArnT-like N-terminal domain-containing protein n=1 Tax=Candidatus Roizmanbacteria bacterium RIFOXYD1_FULL_38_12 TaxID=1802093 RepID=A0A1F7KZD8_9BACT|nr:MAG: hypothetical protein A3K47_00215 [Candidatus Roizmanbacteria bacterium RIFOXYA2_FULL_38_14]OGK63225.1 MAG: hypothetical protein A3K27_00215 [Candidatus Roizmanbacteria bacterium RIFOXYA1_FULL_37_12]OGK65071.1 MAG: hypothetical protein A3K38_00215 [Candidatus Roizmanbacteria bacterium RIFOXYB1_FULL_40_23]OGK68625.1 MAG: hypothetical protein A2334_04105 [Candidatus Roizmanbacteria bacterium RIFOXYB2_FULL_38_10]OGK69475.1 MAG: hypothetical protein A3K21_00215 [Candidatus Roizmanbacteria ba
MNKKVLLILIGISFVSLFFSIFQKYPTPPCFNADEAAFGYNAYSLLNTGRDEYGTLLPLRLKSFGDYKMPLYSYLSIPFIAIFGLNEGGTRALNISLSFLFPFVVYLLSVELFKGKKVGLVAALLSSVSLGFHIVSRHAHETYLAAFLTTLACYLLIKSLQKPSLMRFFFFLITSLLLLFSYHPGRLYVLFFFGFIFLYMLLQKQKNTLLLVLLFVVIGFFGITDLVYKPERLKNLIFLNNAGFSLKIDELKTEGGIRYLYNPLFIGIKEIILDHLTYFSPQFLVVNGDENARFGYPGMSIMTPLEYLFVFIGLYYLFKNKEKWRWFLLLLLFISPLSSSLAWSKGSLTRTVFLLVPLYISSSYGFVTFLSQAKNKYRLLVIFCIAVLFLFFQTLDWDFYLFHYPKRKTVIHAWQCGYKELGTYIKENYSKYDHFYITKDVGMPYIFMLFYLQIQPKEYQKQASLTPADEYGFGQVEKFDKFIFEFKWPRDVEKNSVIVGSIDDFKNMPSELKIEPDKLKSVQVFSETMFQIYEGT